MKNLNITLTRASNHFKLVITREVEGKVTKNEYILPCNKISTVNVLKKSENQLKIYPDGSLHILGLWNPKFNYNINVEGECYIDSLSSVSDVSVDETTPSLGQSCTIKASKLTVSSPLVTSGAITFQVGELINNSHLEAQGNIKIVTSSSLEKGYTVTNTGTIKSTLESVEISGQGLTHTAGKIEARKNLNIRVQNANLLGKLYAYTDRLLLDLQENGAFHYTSDTFQAAQLEIVRKEGWLITTPLNNPGGSIYLYVRANASHNLVVQTSIKAATNVLIAVPVRLVLGVSQEFGEISAKGFVEIHALFFDNSWGKVFAEKKLKLAASEGIVSGAAVTVEKDCDLVPRLSFKHPFYVGNGAFISTLGSLEVIGPSLQNVHGDIYVGGSALVNSLKKLVNVAGNVDIGGDADFSKVILENLIMFESELLDIRLSHSGAHIYAVVKHPVSKPGFVQIGGNCTVDNFRNYSSDIYVKGVMVNLNSKPSIVDYSSYQFYACDIHEARIPKPLEKAAISINYNSLTGPGTKWQEQCSMHRMKAWCNGKNTPSCCRCTPQIVASHEGHMIAQQVIDMRPKTLELSLEVLGIVSAPIVAIWDVSQAIVGSNPSPTQSVLRKGPLKLVHDLIDYARPSGLHEESSRIVSPNFVMKLTIPIPYAPDLPPVVVIHANGLSLNEEDLRAFYEPFHEKKYVTQPFFTNLGNFGPEDLGSSPEEMHFRVRYNAYEAFQQYQRDHTYSIQKPMLVFRKIEYQGKQVEEAVLFPRLYFPASYDKPYLRSERGRVHADWFYLTGNMETGSTAEIRGAVLVAETAHLLTKDRLTITGSVESKNADLLSQGTVEITSLVRRTGDPENYDDEVIRASVRAEEVLRIAGTDVVFTAAKTHSGVKTQISAIRNESDFTLPEEHQRTTHFRGKRKSGTVRQKQVKQVGSEHSSGAAVEIVSGSSARLLKPTINAPEFSVTSRQVVLSGVADREEHESHISEKRGGWRRKTIITDSASVSEVSQAAQLNVEKVTLVGDTVTVGHVKSTAQVNQLRGNTVDFLHGVNRSMETECRQKQDLVWNKAISTSRSSTTFSPPEFSGVIEVTASQTNIEVVQNKPLALLQQLVIHGTPANFISLIEEHVEEVIKQSGPSAGLSLLVTLVASIATQGLAAQFATKLGMSGKFAVAAFKAGFSNIAGRTAQALLANQGNPLRAIRSLINEETLRDLATSILSPSPAPCPANSGLLQYAAGNLVQAGERAALSVAINRRRLSESLASGLTEALVLTSTSVGAQRIGQSRETGFFAHKALHAMNAALPRLALGQTEQALGAAFGAAAVETVADLTKPTPRESIAAAQIERGRRLTLNERDQICEQAIQRTADIARLTTGALSLIANLDMEASTAAAMTAVSNNTVPSFRAEAAVANYFEERIFGEEDAYAAVPASLVSDAFSVFTPLVTHTTASDAHVESILKGVQLRSHPDNLFGGSAFYVAEEGFSMYEVGGHRAVAFRLSEKMKIYDTAKENKYRMPREILTSAWQRGYDSIKYEGSYRKFVDNYSYNLAIMRNSQYLTPIGVYPVPIDRSRMISVPTIRAVQVFGLAGTIYSVAHAADKIIYSSEPAVEAGHQTALFSAAIWGGIKGAAQAIRPCGALGVVFPPAAPYTVPVCIAGGSLLGGGVAAGATDFTWNISREALPAVSDSVVTLFNSCNQQHSDLINVMFDERSVLAAAP